MDWKEKLAKKIKLKCLRHLCSFLKANSHKWKANPGITIYIFSTALIFGCQELDFGIHTIEFSIPFFFFPSTQVLRLVCNNPLFIVLWSTFQFLLDKIPCKYTLICISLTGLSPFPLVMEIWIAIISVFFSSWYSLFSEGIFPHVHFRSFYP